MLPVILPSGTSLEVPDEPADLRDALRERLATGADWRAGFDEDACVGVWLWSLWRPALEPAGMSREQFVDQVVDYGREVWLWVNGERSWQHVANGLAGRLARRLAAEGALAGAPA